MSTITKFELAHRIGMGSNETVYLDDERVELLRYLMRQTKAHNRQCENACNGQGYIPRKGFFTLADESSYLADDWSVFDASIQRIEDRIEKALKDNKHGWYVKYQHDPRGLTVKVYDKADRLLNNY